MSLKTITATTNRIMASINQVRKDSGEKPLVEGTKQWDDTWTAIFHQVEILEAAYQLGVMQAISAL